MSEREQLENMLFLAREAGAKRMIRLLEGELEDLDKPKPQVILDAEVAAELGAASRTGHERLPSSPATPMALEQSSVDMARVEKRANQALRVLRNLRIKPRGRQ
jgi:hypothetical protein